MPVILKNKRVAKGASSRGSKFLLQNSIFKLRSLHDTQTSQSSAFRNNKGFVNSSTSTAAHLPSYLYWLFHRGGIPFEESKQLASARRILLDGKPITDEKLLERQVPWRELAERDFKVVNDRGVPCDPIQRARHRTYAFMRLGKTMTLAPIEEDPRSIIHSLPFVDPTSVKSYNSVTPAGFVGTMRGLLLVTNDALIPPLWHNEFLGCTGRYDIRFHMGTPDEAVEGVRRAIEAEQAKKRYSRDIGVKPLVVLDKMKGRSSSSSSTHVAGRGRGGKADAIERMSMGPLRPDVRLILDTPLFDFRLWTFVRRHTASCTLVKNGPFDVPLETLDAPRKLNVEELEELFSFERRLKTNKIVYGLRALQDDSRGGGSDDPFANLSANPLEGAANVSPMDNRFYDDNDEEDGGLFGSDDNSDVNV